MLLFGLSVCVRSYETDGRSPSAVLHGRSRAYWPFKLTRQENKYILSIIEYYRKYGGVIALPNQEAETVV